MLYNSIKIYLSLQKLPDSATRLRQHLRIFLIAQLLAILSPAMSVIGNILENALLHSLMFIFLGITGILVFFAIRNPSENNNH